jgi:CRP/FNR family transcriptional regulator, cyclic AMP receptor protein
MSIIEILRKNAIFRAVPEETLAEVTAALRQRELRHGEVLFQMGDPGREMVIVQSGGIAIYRPQGGQAQEGQAIRVFKPGEMLGEMSLIDQLPRSTSARAEGDTVILTLDNHAFEQLLRAHPELSSELMREFSGRLRYTTDFISEMRSWVQRMAEGNYQSIQPAGDQQDSSLAALAAEFMRMATQVREREDKLRQEVAQLRIEIDQSKRKQDFSQITESEYYQNLKARLKVLREEGEDD